MKRTILGLDFFFGDPHATDCELFNISSERTQHMLITAGKEFISMVNAGKNLSFAVIAEIYLSQAQNYNEMIFMTYRLGIVDTHLEMFGIESTADNFRSLIADYEAEVHANQMKKTKAT